MEELFDYLDFIALPKIHCGQEDNDTLFNKVQFASCQNSYNIQFKPNDIVILGVNETRNSPFKSDSDSPHIIRCALYSLASINLKGSIIDIGNIKLSDNPTQTYDALRSVVGFLQRTGVTVLIIGGSQELTMPIVQAYKQNIESVNLCLVDSCIGMGTKSNLSLSQTYINKVLESESLSDLSIVGYQSYFISPTLIEFLCKEHFELVRLGAVRKNMREVEPTFRNSDIVSFNIGAVRSSDCLGCSLPSPNGLYAEEVCQLSRFAGYSDRTTCFGIYGYVPDNDVRQQTAMLSAQTIWHFIEGVALRKHEYPFVKADFKKILVNMGNHDTDLLFYKSENSGNWWIEITSDSEKGDLIVPCSYHDYLMASEQEIPDRWYRNFCRMTSK